MRLLLWLVLLLLLHEFTKKRLLLLLLLLPIVRLPGCSNVVLLGPTNVSACWSQ